MIIVNKARCRKCKDVVESKTAIEVVRCKCGALGVSGGVGKTGFLHRLGLNFDELSERETKKKPLQWPW